jgi:hypothetical protein
MSRPGAIALMCLCAAGLAAAGQKNASYAVVEGTVFRDPGLALPDAKVIIQLRDIPESKKSGPKAKKQEAITNYRGEFQFHVPATAGVYVVTATVKGFHPDHKEAAISGGAPDGQERVTVNLVLSPETK